MLYVNLLFLPNQQKVLSILKLFAKLRKDSGKGGKPTHGEGMKIGQVAQRYSISRDNLYYYINYGLLVPPRMDKQYVFDDETLNDLERILELKELGFTLAEIHHILSLFRISDMEKTGFREELRVIYAKRRRGCQEEIAHLERISGVLSQKIEALSTVDTSEYRRTGLPLSMLGLIQCPHCKKPMAISNVTMDTEYIFEADMDCQCGYHADVCDGILLTPNRYEGNDDTPDVHRLMYKDLPAGMISLFQSAYNFMKQQIDGVNLSGKIVMESYINAWFFLYKVGSVLIFISVCANSIGCMVAYTTGSGNILCTLLGLPNWAGSLLFTVPCVLVVWFGLKATGLWEKFMSTGMVVLLGIIVIASFLSGKADVSRAVYANWTYAVPLLSSAIFCYIAQYAVPELARGMRHTPKKLPVAIILGMFITGVLLAVVPLAVLSLTGAEEVTQVATLAWGQALGTWALYTANIFALCAMMTSYWAVGGSMLTNIVDMFKLKDEKDTKTRLIAIACTVLPPFILAYAGLVSFVDAIGWAGTFGGVIMSIVPVLMLNNARKKGDIEPEWKCGWYAHPAVQGMIIVIFSLAAIYFICSMIGILPAGW